MLGKLAGANDKHLRHVVVAVRALHSESARHHKLKLPRTPVPECVDARHPAPCAVRALGPRVEVRHAVGGVGCRHDDLERLVHILQHVLDMHCNGRVALVLVTTVRQWLGSCRLWQRDAQLAVCGTARGNKHVALRLSMPVDIGGRSSRNT